MKGRVSLFQTGATECHMISSLESTCLRFQHHLRRKCDRDFLSVQVVNCTLWFWSQALSVCTYEIKWRLRTGNCLSFRQNGFWALILGEIHTLPRNFIKAPKMMGLDLEARFIIHRLEKKWGLFWAGFQPAFPGCCYSRPQDLPKKWQIRPATWCTGDEDVHVFYVTCSMFDSSTLQHDPTGVGFCVFFLDLGRKQTHCQLGRLIEGRVFRFGVGKFPWR